MRLVHWALQCPPEDLAVQEGLWGTMSPCATFHAEAISKKVKTHLNFINDNVSYFDCDLVQLDSCQQFALSFPYFAHANPSARRWARKRGLCIARLLWPRQVQDL